MTQFFLWSKVFFINCKGTNVSTCGTFLGKWQKLHPSHIFTLEFMLAQKVTRQLKYLWYLENFLLNVWVSPSCSCFGGTKSIDGMFNFNTTFLVNNLGNYSSFILARPKVDCWPSSRWKQSIIKCAYERCWGSTILLWLHITTSGNI